MPAERWRSEMAFHDQQAAERARALLPADYRFADQSYLSHESWIAPAFAALGDLRSLRVLDLGCGHGMAAVVLARRGAHVTACDLSLGYVREARTRAAANGIHAKLLVCNGERLPFADGSFERIWGNAILHHLDMRITARELARVLTPGGKAVFCEPWGGNPWLSLARRRFPYPGKNRTPDEAPLSRLDLDQLRAFFPDMRVRGFQFLSMLGRVLKHGRLVSLLGSLDAAILRRLPRWQHYCRYVVVELRKET